MLLERINGVIWGGPTLIGILGTGVWLLIRTKFAPFRLLPAAVGQLCRKKEQGTGVSSFQALCTALAATVGTGNLVGVAGAIALGGPGAIFWMWVSGLLGMGIKFAEATLAVRFRVRKNGEYQGGPMYYMAQGLGLGHLAGIYSFLGIFAAFGVGNATQVNAVIGSCNQALGALGRQETLGGNLLMGVLIALPVGIILAGGARRIGKAASFLVPVAAGGYVLLGMGALLLRAEAVPGALASIFQGAFSPQAVTGGVIGSGFAALRTGIARGIFTNEAGMGTAAMAHAGADVRHPVEQGMMGSMEVFLDTLVICTMTALVILVSGVPIPYGTDCGSWLTGAAFGEVYGSWTGFFLAAALGVFAFATVLGWGLYGARCVGYLLGEQYVGMFRFLQVGTVIAGAVTRTEVVWLLAELLNGLMALPNLAALVLLCPEVQRLTAEFLPGKTGRNLDKTRVGMVK